jgi:hypothetical protein
VKRVEREDHLKAGGETGCTMYHVPCTMYHVPLPFFEKKKRYPVSPLLVVIRYLIHLVVEIWN